jgi:serine/threonine protein kinase/tetratricopeptide (TPR) repeat protein
VRCPGEDTILGFAEGRLAADELAQIEAHAVGCASCQELLAVVLKASERDVGETTAVTEILGPIAATGESRTEPEGGRKRRGMRGEALAAGTAIGRYTILGLVGRGGMGEVYAAYDPTLDRKVALKLMLPEAAVKDERGQERLLREAQAIAKLSHPNVVVVYDVGTFAARVYVAMEYVEGMTLAEWLAAEPRTWSQIVGVFLEAARGLSAAHRAGFVHRDFKPQNVMVGRDGTARVMDFGLARRMEGGAVPRAPSPWPSQARAPELTRTGQQIGTPAYMAPEQFAGGAVDARADQFSYCVALFWALYGDHPFGTGALPSPAGAANRGDARKSDVPAWIRRVLTRGLRTDPSARWPSMDELAKALSRAPNWRRRIGLMLATIAVGSVAFGIGVSRVIERHRAACTDGAARLAGIWELGDAGSRPGSRREALHAAISKSGGSDAPRIWERVSALLDRRMSTWLAAYSDSCEATNVRHEQSADVLDLRMVCLNDALDSTRALTELLARGDRTVIERATEAVSSLNDFERCSDVRQLRAGIRPPKDPTVRARVAELEKRLRDAKLQTLMGENDEARRVATEVVREAQSLHYCPLEAEATLIIGYVGRPDTREATSALEQAIVLGESCGHDLVVAEAAMDLVSLYAYQDPSHVERYVALSRAALERVGGDARLEGWLAANVASWRLQEGQMDEALRELEKAIEIMTRVLGSEHPEVLAAEIEKSEALYVAGRGDEALNVINRAVAAARRSTPDAMIVYSALASRAEILANLGRLNEAEQDLEVALPAFEARGHALALSFALGTKGEILSARGRSREALPLLERSLHAHSVPAPLFGALDQFEVAKARDAIWPGDRTAFELARRAEAVFASQPSLEWQRRRVDAWLAARQPARRAAKSTGTRKLSGPAALARAPSDDK